MSILALIVCFTIHMGFAQVNRDSSVFIALKKADSLLFKEGFNTCNFDALKKVLHQDLEFLHDQNGTRNSAQFYKAFSESICANANFKPIRQLVEETLQVFVLKNEGKVYGAIQTGAHIFYIKEPNKILYANEQAKFINTWVLVNGNWKLKSILSYEHRPPETAYGPKFNAQYAHKLFDKDSQIEALLKKHKIPSIAIGYIQDGALQQLRTFGVQKKGVPVSSKSIYKVASLTKPIVALVVLKLVEEGTWNLDEPVATYFIDDEIAKSQYLTKLTTRHILSHQSGFPNWRYLTEDKKLSFQFEPGTAWQYSGEGFEYLRKAVEKKMGRPFDEIAQEKLFEPLKMNSTYFNWKGSVDENLYAVEHDENGDPIPFEKYTHTNAAANLMTTAEEYAIFMTHILHGAGLSKKIYDELLKPEAHEKKGIDWSLGMQLLSDLPNGDLA